MDRTLGGRGLRVFEQSELSKLSKLDSYHFFVVLDTPEHWKVL